MKNGAGWPFVLGFWNPRGRIAARKVKWAKEFAREICRGRTVSENLWRYLRKLSFSSALL